MVKSFAPETVAVLERVAQVRSEGKKIVVASGCFDILHVGHIRYLKAARALGDFLVVLVSDDPSVCAMKGVGRPIIPAVERAELLKALAVVDEVIIHRQVELIWLLQQVAPCIFAKGSDYGQDSLSWLEDIVGKIAFVGDNFPTHTSDIIRRCAQTVQDV